MGGLLGVGAGLVVFLWWHDSATKLSQTRADQLVAMGRLSGLVGTYLALMVVLLLARVPWLDWLVGMDRLVAWHRRLARYAIGLLVGHALFIWWGYALADHIGLGREGHNLIGSYPDVLAATVALLILVAVGAISASAVKRRVSYHTWYFVHLYTYLAIVLSFAHQLAVGGDFVTHPLNRAAWVGMYLAVGGQVAWYRVAVPVRKALYHDLRVEAVVAEGRGVTSLYITGRELHQLDAHAGQFFLWRFVTRDMWWEAHPFSLSAAPDGRQLRLTVKAVGDFTHRLADLRPGVRVMAEGPYGSFTWERRARRRVLLIGAGVGIAPLRALLEELPAAPGELTLLYRESSPESVLFRAELDALAARRGARVLYVCGTRSRYPDPLPPAQLLRLVPEINQHDVYVCGPPRMMSAVGESLRAAGVPGSRIHTECFDYA